MSFEKLASPSLNGFAAAPGMMAGNRKLIGYLRTNWSNDPFSFGSYSHFVKGTDRSLVTPLAAPVADRIFFAGEAMHPDYNSTVHAALESGQMAADALCTYTVAAQNIAVIGAGVSGLSAAQRLAVSGKSVTIFEARERIGGRVWTNRDLGPPLELGASWIHGISGNPISAIADAHSIARIENGKDMAVRGGDGRLIPDNLAPDWLDMIADEQNSLGADPKTLNLDLYDDHDGYQGPDNILPSGYDNIFAALSGDYAVQLSAPVDHVRYDADGVTIRHNGGISARFDAVIITVPLGVLKQGGIFFDPPLPAAKQEAIAQMGMGTLDKLYLLFESVFWDDTTYITTPENALPRGHFNDWMTFHKYLDVPVILAFNGGPAALELAADDDETLLTKALKTLDMAYPGA